MPVSRTLFIRSPTLRNTPEMTEEQDDEAIRERIAELRIEHRDLDAAIHLLAEDIAGTDQLRLTRMKKRKLLLKDAIARLESSLIPDLDA